MTTGDDDGDLTRFLLPPAPAQAMLGGNDSPTAADLTKIMAAVGVEADGAMVEKFLAEVAGKDVAALIA